MRNDFFYLLDQINHQTKRQLFRSKRQLAVTFFKVILSIVQDTDSSYVKSKTQDEVTTYEFDTQQFDAVMRDAWSQQVKTYIQERRLSLAQLMRMYLYIRDYARFLMNEMMAFEENIHKPQTLSYLLFNAFEEKYPNYQSWKIKKEAPDSFSLDDIVYSTVYSVTMRIADVMGYMKDAIKDELALKVDPERQFVYQPMRETAYRAFVEDRLDATVEQHERWLPQPIDQLRKSPLPRYQTLSHAPSIKPVSPSTLTFKQKWGLLSTRQKWLMAGILLFEVAVVVALGVAIPGSEAVTVPAASAVAANVLASMLGTVVLACTTAGCAYRVFQQRQPDKFEQLEHSPEHASTLV